MVEARMKVKMAVVIEGAYALEGGIIGTLRKYIGCMKSGTVD